MRSQEVFGTEPESFYAGEGLNRISCSKLTEHQACNTAELTALKRIGITAFTAFARISSAVTWLIVPEKTRTGEGT